MLKVGLLWYDDNPGRDLAEKLRPAIRRYRQKYGTEPDLCLVNADTTLPDRKPVQIGDVRVMAGRSVLAHHFWLGRRARKRRRRRPQPAPTPPLMQAELPLQEVSP